MSTIPTYRPITKTQLRGLRGLLSRAAGLRRSKVRVVVRPDTSAGRDCPDPQHVEVFVRFRYPASTDWIAWTWSAESPRGVVRRIARRCEENDLP